MSPEEDFLLENVIVAFVFWVNLLLLLVGV